MDTVVVVASEAGAHTADAALMIPISAEDTVGVVGLGLADEEVCCVWITGLDESPYRALSSTQTRTQHCAST